MKNIKRQLSQADPLKHVALHSLPDAAVKALAQEIVMHEQSTTPSPMEEPDQIRAAPQNRRWHRWIVGVCAGLIVVPTAAAAVVGGMHTGIFAPEPPDGLSSMNAVGEEFLNSNSPEIRSVVRDLTTEFPLPAGATYGPLLDRYPSKENTFEQRTTLAQRVAFYAQCTWYQDWLKGDATRRKADQPTIDAMPTWKYWNFAVDDATGHNSGLEGLNQIAAETRAGTTTTISQYVDANCTSKSPEHWTPDPSPSS